MNFKESMEIGRDAEQRFAATLTNPVFATKEEDINDHWDVMDSMGYRYDVKAMKKYTRSWWIVVKREDLVKFIEGAIWGNEAKIERPKPYELYQRPERQDLMTVIPTVDLLAIAERVDCKE